jgi:hypothetical protein
MEPIFTSMNRDTKDQFYTKSNISNMCIEYVIETVNYLNSDVFIEPSAGAGSFSDIMYNTFDIVEAYDIDPKPRKKIKKISFFDIKIKKNKVYHILGNPPFGRQSSLAKQFIKHACSFAKSISFILPKSFRTDTYKAAFDRYFHLEFEIDLPDNTFEINGIDHRVPCIFQIWIKRDTPRIIPKKQVSSGYKFVRPNNENKIKKQRKKAKEDSNIVIPKNTFDNEPDFAIKRAGGGQTCGSLHLNYTNTCCYPDAFLFVKLDSNINKQKFIKKYGMIDWTADSNVGAKSISKQRFITEMNSLL